MILLFTRLVASVFLYLPYFLMACAVKFFDHLLKSFGLSWSFLLVSFQRLYSHSLYVISTETKLLFNFAVISLSPHLIPWSNFTSPYYIRVLYIHRFTLTFTVFFCFTLYIWILSLFIHFLCSVFPLPPESCCRSRPHPLSSSSSSIFLFPCVGRMTPPPHLPQQVALLTLSAVAAALGAEPHHERAFADDAAGRDGRWHMLTFISHWWDSGVFTDRREEEVTDWRRERGVNTVEHLILSHPSLTCVPCGLTLPPPFVYE